MNITAVQTKSTTYKNLEDLIKEKLPAFSFEEGKVYRFQLFGSGRICEKNTIPEEIEGFEYYKPIQYKHETGMNIYVRSCNNLDNNNLIVNISKDN